MTKRFVLDTNVLLCDPQALFAFGDNEVVIPIYVLEELDNFKTAQSELGRSAREVARSLDALREKGCLREGISIGREGGTLRVAMATRSLPDECHLENTADNRILATVLQQSTLAPGKPTTLVTRDVNLRIRADSLGLSAESYEADRVEWSDRYRGFATLACDTEDIDDLFASGSLPSDELFDEPRSPHEFACLVSGPSQSALTRSFPDGMVRPVRKCPPIWGIEARNVEQRCALDLLMDPAIPLVTLAGRAGTGKTLLAIAAGLQQTAEGEPRYKRVLVSRPIMPLGRDIGFLPGSLDEKIDPWMQPIWDNVELLTGTANTKTEERGRASRSANGHKHPTQPRQSRRPHTELIDLGILQIEPLTYIRGRSIPSQFMIVDEAQNLTPHEVKTIITRAAEGTKIVLTGDPDQIDHPYLDATNNGLVHTIERFRTSPRAGHIELWQGERSELAEEAADRL